MAHACKSDPCVTLLVNVLQTISWYMVAVLVLPDTVVDLREHYFAHKNRFFAAMFGSVVFNAAKELALGGHMLGHINGGFHVIFCLTASGRDHAAGMVSRAVGNRYSFAVLPLDRSPVCALSAMTSSQTTRCFTVSDFPTAERLWRECALAYLNSADKREREGNRARIYTGCPAGHGCGSRKR
jgi:hypothetical protein